MNRAIRSPVGHGLGEVDQSHQQDSGRDKNDVGEVGCVARSDQTDGSRNTLLERRFMVLKVEVDSSQDALSLSNNIYGVHLLELLGHVSLPEIDCGEECLQDLVDRGNAIDQRDVDGLDLRPEGKTAVGDDQHVGVTDAGDQREDRGVENAGFEHGF